MITLIYSESSIVLYMLYNYITHTIYVCMYSIKIVSNQDYTITSYNIIKLLLYKQYLKMSTVKYGLKIVSCNNIKE